MAPCSPGYCSSLTKLSCSPAHLLSCSPLRLASWHRISLFPWAQNWNHSRENQVKCEFWMHATCYSKRVNKKPLGIKNQIFRYEKICLSYTSLSSWPLSLLVYSLARASFLIQHSSGCGYTSLRLGSLYLYICSEPFPASYSSCGWLAMNFLSVTQLVISPLPTPHLDRQPLRSLLRCVLHCYWAAEHSGFSVSLNFGWLAHTAWLLVVVAIVAVVFQLWGSVLAVLLMNCKVLIVSKTQVRCYH